MCPRSSLMPAVALKMVVSCHVRTELFHRSDSTLWCPVTGKRVMGTSWSTGSSIWENLYCEADRALQQAAREAVESLSLGALKTHLDVTLCNLLWVGRPALAGVWTIISHRALITPATLWCCEKSFHFYKNNGIVFKDHLYPTYLCSFCSPLSHLLVQIYITA